MTGGGSLAAGSGLLFSVAGADCHSADTGPARSAGFGGAPGRAGSAGLSGGFIGVARDAGTIGGGIAGRAGSGRLWETTPGDGAGRGSGDFAPAPVLESGAPSLAAGA